MISIKQWSKMNGTRFSFRLQFSLRPALKCSVYELTFSLIIKNRSAFVKWNLIHSKTRKISSKMQYHIAIPIVRFVPATMTQIKNRKQIYNYYFTSHVLHIDYCKHSNSVLLFLLLCQKHVQYRDLHFRSYFTKIVYR